MYKRNSRSEKMTLGERVDEWLCIANEDLEVAEMCLSAGKNLHCAFLCQQAVEKILKACIAANDETPLPIHNLPGLASDAGLWELLTVEQKLFLRATTTYAIETRYPGRKKSLVEQCTKEEVGKILASTKEMVVWLKEIINEKLFQEK
ncbi:MAG: HEPN domain-containing protein [Dehalococcoidia bacterium]|nr:MAG: HEPN domain-containing protein [Dehalococcoidia bacterium]